MRFLSPTANRRLNELAGFLGMTLAVLLLLSLVSYRPSDISLDVATSAGFSHPVHNWIGIFGAYLADMLYQIVGYGAILLPVGMILLSLRWLRSSPVSAPAAKLIGFVLLVGSGDALAGMLSLPRVGGTIEAGGAIGALGAKALIAAFNPLGAHVVALALLLAALFLTTKFSFTGSASWLGRAWPSAWIEGQVDRFHDWREGRAEERAKRKLEKIRSAGHPPVPTQISLKEAPAKRVPLREPEEIAGDLLPRLAPADEDAPARAASPAASAARGNPPVVSFHPHEAVEARPGPDPKIARMRASFRLPSPGLLRMAERPEKFDEAELKSEARAIEQKCMEFGVGGHVTQINPGPVVTTFEFKPEAGVKYSRITALAEDLCLALRAESILIERIPGKATVGIEVPNVRRQTIALREVIESSEFVNSGSKLTIALGKDLIGRIRIAELNQMPHLLIAGATGTGKSVFINSLMISMLYKATPDELKLILIDPKRLELGLYEDIPHLFTPVVTDPKVASNVLRNATREMENRLKLLAKKGVRNIDQYNRVIAKNAAAAADDADAPQPPGAEPPDAPLPYLVIVIDELADLMMVDTSNVEESITRLAQMARAVGIHLLLATQRPSVDVITGLIKANFPARISFRVATKVDSRTILDANGSESLLGRGDMLYLPAGSSRLERVHGPLVSEDEIVAVCDFWRSQAKAAYHTELLEPPKEEPDAEVIEAGGEAGDDQSGGDGQSDDNLYEEAVRVVCEMGRASTSTLQRRLRIGYGRAARLIDLMEKDGIVGPADGPRPREVLKKRDWMREWDQTPH
ncbi:MAG TPA: DNA translocase FtsK [Patescibacteria group bacterium]|nr:DNA translocase FtsK [Patescibacteria group bacterium]